MPNQNFRSVVTDQFYRPRDTCMYIFFGKGGTKPCTARFRLSMFRFFSFFFTRQPRTCYVINSVNWMKGEMKRNYSRQGNHYLRFIVKQNI